MKYLLKILGIYLAFLIQSIIFEDIKIFSCSPDILIVAIIICSVSAGNLHAAFLGGFAGLLTDVFFGDIFGLNTLIYMYLAFFVSLAVDAKTDNSPLLMAWVTFATITLMEIILTVLKSLFGYSVSMSFLGANVFVKGVFGALLALLFVALKQYIIKKRKEQTDAMQDEPLMEETL